MIFTFLRLRLYLFSAVATRDPLPFGFSLRGADAWWQRYGFLLGQTKKRSLLSQPGLRACLGAANRGDVGLQLRYESRLAQCAALNMSMPS
jgi:hypothetical protein